MRLPWRLSRKLASLKHRKQIGAIREAEKKFKDLYADFVRLENPRKIAVAQELIDQIGTVDAEIEGYSSPENQRDLSIKFAWGHDHVFCEDLAVRGRMGSRHTDLIAEFFVGFDLEDSYFKGKSVVDVGCWTGGTTLMLKALGAADILALEEVQKYARSTQRLVSEVYDLENVVVRSESLFRVTSDKKFDVVYFPGVVYHLSDPVLGLRRLFNLLRDGGEILVESAGLDRNEPIAEFSGNRIFEHEENGESLSRGGWNWFLPTPSCLERWMAEAGFRDIRCHYSYSADRVYGIGRRRHHVEITRAGLSVPDVE